MVIAHHPIDVIRSCTTPDQVECATIWTLLWIKTRYPDTSLEMWAKRMKAMDEYEVFTARHLELCKK